MDEGLEVATQIASAGITDVWEQVWDINLAGIHTTSVAQMNAALVGVASVAACGTPPSPRGEDCNCGQTYPNGHLKVSCAEAFVEIPSNVKVLDIRTDVREGGGGPWVQPNSLGWCDYAGRSDYITSVGSRHIGVTLKNWSHNRDRLVRITVYSS